MNQIKIKKVKIVKGKSLEVAYVKTELDNTTTKVSEEHNAEVHSDLKKAFSGLNIHLGILSEFIPSAKIKDLDNVGPELAEDFHVTSYSIGGDEDDEGVVLTGHKTLKNGKALIMNTPFTRFNESEQTGYKFIDDLQSKIGVIESEVLKYLHEDKRAEDPQQELPFGEAVTHLQIASPESQEDRDEAMLNKLRGKPSLDQANPEAMKDVAEMPNGPTGGQLAAVGSETKTGRRRNS